MLNGEYQPTERNPSAPPELRVVLTGEDLLERARVLGADIDHRVHELVREMPTEVIGKALRGQTREAAAVVLATKLLERLMLGRE
jgi:hypothetical protein